MELPDFLYLDADHEVRFKGHRLRIVDVASRFREGHSPEGIAFDIYPTLDLRLVYKAIAFYLDHQAEIDLMVDENAAELEGLNNVAGRREREMGYGGDPDTSPANRLDARIGPLPRA